MPITPNCSCPSDSEIQTLAKVNHNLILLFSTMSSDAWKGKEVSLTGCGCSEPQMLAAINGNIISFFNWLAENPIGGSSFVAFPASASAPGEAGQYSQSAGFAALCVATDAWVFWPTTGVYPL